MEDNSACNHDHVETDLNTWHFYINGYMAVKEEIDTACRSSYAGSDWNCIGRNRQRRVPLMNSECGMVWGVQDSAATATSAGSTTTCSTSTACTRTSAASSSPR